MKEQKTDSYVCARSQVDRVRELYAQIGEPLPEDVVFDLLQHLDRALELEKEDKRPANKRKLNA